MDKDELKTTLRQTTVFKTLPDEALEMVISQGNMEEIPQGTNIVTEDHSSDSIYFILDGEVDYMKRLDDESTFLIARRGKGDGFGFTSAIDGKSNLITAIAVTAVSCYRLTYDDFWAICASNPMFEHHLLEQILLLHSNHLRQITVRLREFLAKMLNNPGDRILYP